METLNWPALADWASARGAAGRQAGILLGVNDMPAAATKCCTRGSPGCWHRAPDRESPGLTTWSLTRSAIGHCGCHPSNRERERREPAERRSRPPTSVVARSRTGAQGVPATVARRSSFSTAVATASGETPSVTGRAAAAMVRPPGGRRR